MTHPTFIDSFSVGLDDLPRKEITEVNVLRILNEQGRFSTFEASANDTIARFMTRLMKGSLVESYVPDRYKAKPEPGGAVGYDQDTYPWTYVRLTPAGKKLIGDIS